MFFDISQLFVKCLIIVIRLRISMG